MERRRKGKDMIEVEVKLPLAECSPQKVIAELEKRGFEQESDILEEDRYFDTDDHKMQNGGMALRIRTVTKRADGKENALITFKGPKTDQISMTRKELETAVGDGKTGMKLLEALGFYCVEPVVQKHRREYRNERICVCVDRVEGLGDFLEFEIMISEDEDKEQALKEIRSLMEELGFSMKETTRTSYLSLLQKKLHKK